MKNKYTIVLVFAVIVSMFSVIPVHAETGNQVVAQLGYRYGYSTDEDILENVPVVWSHGWFANMINTPDITNLPVPHPKVEFQTNLNLVSFYPNDPTIFTAQPNLGIYTWDFNGLELLQSEMMPLNAETPENTLTTRPRFTASRSVTPETLENEVTYQTVTLTVTFEESFPSEVNNVLIHMGAPRIAYEQYPLVEGQFVSMVDVPGWNSGTDGISAYWSTNPSNIEIGKTYTFQGVLKSVKSLSLLGSPIFKPGVKVGYSRGENPIPPITGNSVTFTDPDNVMSATFSSSDIVDWIPDYTDNWFDFWFNSKVSQTTPPPPPFYVIAPANVQIEPDTLNLKSNGELITAYIEFPEVYDVNNIDVSSIRLITLSGEVPVDLTAPATVGDYDGDGISDLMVKFDRSIVVGQLGSTDVVDDGTGIDKQFELKVAGQLIDETQFEGTDTVRVIKKGK